MALNITYEWVRAAEHAPGGPFRVLERRYGLAEIVERGRGVIAERPSNTPRRVVGQWGGAGGALCEDHFALAGSVGVAAAACKREKPVLLLLLFPPRRAHSCLSTVPFATGPKRSMGYLMGG